jgi:ribonuclease Z
LRLVARVIGGLTGDPAVYAQLQQTGEAILFDLGTLDGVSNRELLKAKTALVSHAHLDHFCGFDKWLRVHVPYGCDLLLAGPPGFARNVQGKLRGYLWNLLDPGQLRFTVYEVYPDGALRCFRLRNDDAFKLHEQTPAPPPLTAIDPPLPPPPVASFPCGARGLRIEAVALDHKTPSIAYAVQFPCRLKVQEDVLAAHGLTPGPWIRELQIAAAQRDLAAVPPIPGLFAREFPKPFGYVTDIGFTPDNAERLRLLMRGVDHLLCEANYRDRDAAKALDRMHLTTVQAATLAHLVEAKSFGIFHVSNLYADDPAAAEAEALATFAALRAAKPSNKGAETGDTTSSKDSR